VLVPELNNGQLLKLLGRAPHREPEVDGEVRSERRLIVLSAGSYVNVTRIIPPLVTTAAEVDQALSILEDSLAAAGA
jgi:acetylornithine/succinyldiaminopimelate/putrescine aminotransferase